MHIIFKLSLLIVFFAVVKSESTEEVYKCNLRYCGAELLNFDHFSFTQLFRKIEIGNFCIKNCTPPVVHEFFQSIIYGITKKIPGHCRGQDCVDKNRFVALVKCVEEQAWPLLQCSKRLIDLAHIGLVKNPADERRNTTCEIVTESVQCIEESLQRCGDSPFQLVKEILGDLINVGINAYCHPSYREEGLFIKRTTGITADPSAPVTEEYTGPTYEHPQFVKGYRSNHAQGFPTLSYFCLLFCVILSAMLSSQRA